MDPKLISHNFESIGPNLEEKKSHGGAIIQIRHGLNTLFAHICHIMKIYINQPSMITEVVQQTGNKFCGQILTTFAILVFLRIASIIIFNI